VVDEFDPTLTDESLNPFNPDHGPPYAAEFIGRYRAAQRARNQRITDWAKAELARVNAAGLPDSLFPLFRTWGDLRCMDPAIDPSDRPTPRCYRGHPAQANRAFGIGRSSSLKTWLSMWSLETSQCQGAPQLAKIDVPSLVVQSTADMGVFPSDARAIYGALAARDKRLELVPGAHYFEDSQSNRRAVVELMVEWLRGKL
jgi:pimeloyl-ACP methyl ester carboxylesterase